MLMFRLIVTRETYLLNSEYKVCRCICKFIFLIKMPWSHDVSTHDLLIYDECLFNHVIIHTDPVCVYSSRNIVFLSDFPPAARDNKVMFDCQKSVDHVFECVSVSVQSLCSSGVLCEADVVCVSAWRSQPEPSCVWRATSEETWPSVHSVKLQFVLIHKHRWSWVINTDGCAPVLWLAGPVLL